MLSFAGVIHFSWCNSNERTIGLHKAVASLHSIRRQWVGAGRQASACQVMHGFHSEVC